MGQLPRRHWYQVSLRSQFLLTLLVATFLAGYTTAMRQVEQALRTEREAAQRAANEARLAEELAAKRSEQAVGAAFRWLRSSSGAAYKMPEGSAN